MYPKSGGKFNTGLESLEACQHKVKITEGMFASVQQFYNYL